LVPIDPVEPRTVRVFIVQFLPSYITQDRAGGAIV